MIKADHLHSGVPAAAIQALLDGRGGSASTGSGLHDDRRTGPGTASVTIRDTVQRH